MRNIRVTATCDQCRKRWEAVMLEGPAPGLNMAKTLGLIPKEDTDGDSLEFARRFYQKAFDQGHPQHRMLVTSEFTSLAAFPPRQAPYVA